MATQQSAQSFINYYSSLLILQYLNKLKATGSINTVVTPVVMPQTTIQTISFSSAPSSGNFVLRWKGVDSAAIAWNDSTATIQTKIQAITGLSLVTVAGSISGLFLTVTFTGVAPVAAFFTTTSNTLSGSSGAVSLSYSAADVILPLALQNAFNLIPTVQTLNFSDIVASGSFYLVYQGVTSSAISWNSTPAQVQAIVQALVGINNLISVSGSILSQSLIISLSVPAGTTLFTVASNTLLNGASAAITITNVPNTAVGNQLDILGEYAGVTRTGSGSGGVTITLNDSDFLVLIQLAIIRNNSGSSLATIQALLNQFFPGEILVFDYTNMRMSYLINSSLGSQNLVQLFVSEGLLPKPMGVQLSVTVYFPVITSFFGFRTYDLPSFNAKPFNTYDSYNLTWTWLSYADGITV